MASCATKRANTASLNYTIDNGFGRDGQRGEPVEGRQEPAQQTVSAAAAHEVWLVDQSNSPGKPFGGTISIFDGATLRADAARAPREVIDLGAATSSLCLSATGAAPVRPHMLVFNSTFAASHRSRTSTRAASSAPTLTASPCAASDRLRKRDSEALVGCGLPRARESRSPTGSLVTHDGNPQGLKRMPRRAIWRQ